MSEANNEFTPDWGDDPGLHPGMYIWEVRVLKAAWVDLEREKPYGKLECQVLSGEQVGTKWDFRLYVTKAARPWAVYFLKKFGYPEELLAASPPTIRCSDLAGLEGKMWVQVADSEYGLKIEAKGFERLNEMELEEKLNTIRAEGVTLPAEPVVDLEADVKKEAAPAEDFGWAEGGEEKKGYEATDDDIPAEFWGAPPEAHQ